MFWAGLLGIAMVVTAESVTTLATGVVFIFALVSWSWTAYYLLSESGRSLFQRGGTVSISAWRGGMEKR